MIAGRYSLEKRLMNCRAALFARRGPLYGNRNIFFQLEKSYQGYDGMLKRDMLYARYGVREVVAEARAAFAGQAATLEVWRHPGFDPAAGGPASFVDLLKGKGLIPAPGAQMRPLLLDGLRYEMTLHLGSPDLVILGISASNSGTGMARRRFRKSGTFLMKAWMQSLLQEWIGKPSQLQLDSRNLILATVNAAEWTVSRRISQIDMDCSGEDMPQAFRWLETGISKASRYDDLPDSEIAKILSVSGIDLPTNAVLQGKTQSELSKDSSCLSIRYAHLIPDAEPSPDGHAGLVPPYMNPGLIVMENDYLEILIDAGTGKVFGESKKWRPEPDQAHRLPEQELAGQDSAY